jgi:hypothetical protein
MLLISAINFSPRTKHTSFTPKHILFFPPHLQIYFLSHNMHSGALNRCENSVHCKKKMGIRTLRSEPNNLFVGEKKDSRKVLFFKLSPHCGLRYIFYHLFTFASVYISVCSFLFFYYKEIPLT